MKREIFAFTFFLFASIASQSSLAQKETDQSATLTTTAFAPFLSYREAPPSGPSGREALKTAHRAQ